MSKELNLIASGKMEIRRSIEPGKKVKRASDS